MFHSQRLNNRIDTTPERALRIIYQDYATSSIDLLAKDVCLTHAFPMHPFFTP